MAIRLPSSDLYAELGVTAEASADDISAAFRARARELHPDTNPDPAALERFKVLSAAYKVLRDPEDRARYDEGRRVRLGPATPGRPSAVTTDPVPGVPDRVRTADAPVASLFGWHMTRRRAGWILGAGIACVLLACAVTVWVVADPGTGDDSGRTVTLALVAAKLLIGGMVAIVLGSRRLGRTAR